jgi:hypothetical protein
MFILLVFIVLVFMVSLLVVVEWGLGGTFKRDDIKQPEGGTSRSQ